ncbi:MAG: EVE domain-containing protein [Planctomycetaceae bacterium]|nr:EVE domain-containing protein [Planctomycetaceae bacterium]
MAKAYWLLKSEPDVFSIHDLEAAPNQTTDWGGVRNYQARNFIRDQMKPGDHVLFYHSNAEPSGVAGVAEISSAAYPDSTALDATDPYFDPKSRLEQPTWFAIDVRWVQTFAEIVSLEQLKADPALVGMEVLRRGSRLSVQMVSKLHFDRVLKMANARRKNR